MFYHEIAAYLTIEYIFMPHFFKKDFIHLFLERGEGREKERERNTNVWLPLAHPALGAWPATQACALTGNQIGDSLVHRPALNPLSHTSRGLTNFYSNVNYRHNVVQQIDLYNLFTLKNLKLYIH